MKYSDVADRIKAYNLGRSDVVLWITNHKLIKPNRDSLTRFESYYHIEKRDLEKMLDRGIK